METEHETLFRIDEDMAEIARLITNIRLRLSYEIDPTQELQDAFDNLDEAHVSAWAALTDRLPEA